MRSEKKIGFKKFECTAFTRRWFVFNSRHEIPQAMNMKKTKEERVFQVLSKL